MVDLTGIFRRRQIELEEEFGDEIWDSDDEYDYDSESEYEDDDDYSTTSEESVEAEVISGVIRSAVTFEVVPPETQEPQPSTSTSSSGLIFLPLKEFVGFTDRPVSGKYANFLCPGSLALTLDEFNCYNGQIENFYSPFVYTRFTKMKYEELFRSFGYTQTLQALEMILMILSYRERTRPDNIKFIEEYFNSISHRTICVGKSERTAFEYETVQNKFHIHHKIILIRAGIWKDFKPYYVWIVREHEAVIGKEGKYVEQFITTSSVSKIGHDLSLFSGVIPHMIGRTYIWFIRAAGTTLRKYFTYLVPN